MGGASYTYDGEGRRIQQTVGANVTKYLLDLQPGLSVVLAETVSANTKRFVHAPMGIHAQEDASGVWTWAVQDALGSVRLEASNAVAVNGSRNFGPYLPQFGLQGTFTMPFAATGEQTDGNGQVYLRARYYTPSIGVFDSLDPVEGMVDRPMSLNGYSWVEGNTPNALDPSGMFGILSSIGFVAGSQSIATLLSSGICGVETELRAKPPSQENNGSCSMRQSRGYDILAVTADSETDDGGRLAQNGQAIAALMLMQINNFRTGQGNVIVNGGHWRQIGLLDFNTVQANPVRTMINGLAEAMVTGYCDYNGDPLAFFDYSNGSDLARMYRTLYPAIAQNLVSLRQLSRDDTKRFEVSFHSDNLQDVLADFRDNPETYDNPYVVVVPGAARGVIIGNGNVTNLNIFYQCGSGTNPVLRPGVNPAAQGKQRGVDFDCTRCITETRRWWWTNDYVHFEELSNADFNTRRATVGGAGYVKSCTPQPQG